MTVSEFATTDVVTAALDTPILDIVAAMDDENVGSVVVVDEDEPVGIVTDRKIALATRDHDDLGSATASDVIGEGTELISVEQDADVFDALQLMEEHAIRRIPVRDDGNHLAGIVTLDDVIVMLSEQSNSVAGVVRGQTRL